MNIYIYTPVYIYIFNNLVASNAESKKESVFVAFKH